MILAVAVMAGCSTQSPEPERRKQALALEDEAVGEDLPVSRGVGESGWAGSADDRDRDGVPAASDLDDGDELVHSSLDAVPCGEDHEACAERAEDIDVDGDGVGARNDCDDLDPSVSPASTEQRCNGEDENCNGVDDCDQDGDGLRDVDDPEPDLPAVDPLFPADPPRWP